MKLASMKQDHSGATYATATLEGIGGSSNHALLNLAERLDERARKIRESLAKKCWCGESASELASGVLGREWCHEHAPRCPSGAHFHGNCKCKGGRS